MHKTQYHKITKSEHPITHIFKLNQYHDWLYCILYLIMLEYDIQLMTQECAKLHSCEAGGGRSRRSDY